MSRLLRFRAGFVVILAVLASPGGAMAERIWMEQSHENGAALVYGTPESDDIAISFQCMPPDRMVNLSIDLGPVFVPRQGTIQLVLSADGTDADVALTGTLNWLEEMEIVILEARTGLSSPLKRLLKEGETLNVAIAERIFSFPLEGAQTSMRALEHACAMPG